jgi:8-oxo-dGTP pyrophosphatase MutT (NUDIX family)
LRSAVRIVDVAELDFAFEPRPWRFAQTHSAAIAAHWARLSTEKPKAYNGRVLLMRRYALARRTDGKLKLEGDYFETNYADFVAWRAIGDSDEPVVHGFAMAALHDADGAYLLGEMAPHTVNGGQIYFPGGTPDPNDVVNGKVDLDASVRREVFEETGVRAEETVVASNWTVAFVGSRIACLKPMTLPSSADEAKARIEAFLAREALPELARMHIVRRTSDIDEARVPVFISAYLHATLEGGGQEE